MWYWFNGTLLEEEKSGTWNPICPVFRTLGEKGSQKGSLHGQEPKKVPYITKNDSKEPKKFLKMVLKTHLEPFRELSKGPPVGQPKNPVFLRVYALIAKWKFWEIRMRRAQVDMSYIEGIKMRKEEWK